VRRTDTIVQMGLTNNEIERIWKRVKMLREMIDDGEIATY
jgi:hypothetical protein